MKKRFVIRKPHSTALWSVWDHSDGCFVITGMLSYSHAVSLCVTLNDREKMARRIQLAIASAEDDIRRADATIKRAEEILGC